MSTSAIKSSLKTALAESLYNEILYNTNPYYYFLGKPVEWVDNKIDPIDNNLAAEIDARNNIVTVKKVTSADVSFIVPRYDWTSGEVYDMYDNQIQVSVNVSAGAASTVLGGSFDRTTFGPGWIVSGSGIASETTVVSVTNDNVTLSEATTAAINGSVSFTKPTASASTLEDCRFFVLAANNNVYKCLYNNNNSPSTVQPSSFSSERFETTDGYIWKYMYTIPSAFVNRFLTSTDIPVTTAVKQSYYSGGAISSITALNYGVDYAGGDQLVVNGDGHLTGNKYQLLTASVDNPGSGYTTTPTATIDYPKGLNDVILQPFEQSTAYNVGDYLEYDNRVYLVTEGGTSGTTWPVHSTSTPVVNGGISLQYVGTRAVCELTLDGDNVDTVTLTNGVIGHIKLTDVGSGYTSIPSVDITTDGLGSGALATAKISVGGYVSGITVTNPGSGYKSSDVNEVDIDGTATANAVVYYGYGYDTIPTVNVAPPFSPDDVDVMLMNNYNGTEYNVIKHPVLWDSEASYSSLAGDVVVYENIVYRCTEINPTTSTPSLENPDWQKIGIMNNNNVYSWDSTLPLGGAYVNFSQYVCYLNRYYFVENDGMLSLTSPPVHSYGSALCGDVGLTFAGETAVVSIFAQKTKAEVLPVIQTETGQILGAIVVDGGEGYTAATVDVISSSGSDAQLIPDLSYGDLNTQQANIELLAVPGTIDSIDILDGGSGYDQPGGVASTVVIEGDGTGCVAETVVEDVGETAGVITKIRIITPGSGYTRASVTINGDKVDQAYCRAIISPVKGHGSNAVKELFATDLSFSTTVIKGLNQGFNIENEYRQLGLIKNLSVYDSNLRYTDFTGSACFVIAGDFSEGAEDDQLITDEGGNRYRVVAATITNLLVQAIDNTSLAVGDVVNYANGRTPTASYDVTLTSVIEPSIDKYSGEMLFIDNRAAFKPTTDQTVSIKTSIRL